jgi:mannan endo-1,4-beta-mannosidase
MTDVPTKNGRGFHVQRDRLLDAHGRDFVMRGVNHGHAWFPDQLGVAMRAIAATGANTVRLVLATGGQWPRTSGREIQEILEVCQANGLVAVLEVHDGTGWGEKPEARPLSEMVDYWLSRDIFAALQGHEALAILNLANEPFGNGVDADTYVTENVNAIRRLREGGYRHTLMVDGANWGQDGERTMFSRADEIAAADPDGNIVFSVHMYEHYGTEEIVAAYLDGFKGRLPLVVGEFAADHGANGDVDELSILKWTHLNGQGCLGWSWKGNAAPLEGLDIALTWDGELSPWGRTLVEHPCGIRATSLAAFP